MPGEVGRGLDWKVGQVEAWEHVEKKAGKDGRAGGGGKVQGRRGEAVRQPGAPRDRWQREKFDGDVKVQLRLNGGGGGKKQSRHALTIR